MTDDGPPRYRRELAALPLRGQLGAGTAIELSFRLSEAFVPKHILLASYGRDVVLTELRIGNVHHLLGELAGFYLTIQGGPNRPHTSRVVQRELDAVGLGHLTAPAPIAVIDRQLETIADTGRPELVSPNLVQTVHDRSMELTCGQLVRPGIDIVLRFRGLSAAPVRLCGALFGMVFVDCTQPALN